MKKTFKILITYFSVFLTFTFIYFFLFHTSLFSLQKVLFYRGIFLLLINILIFFVFAIFINKKSKLNLERLIGAIIISASINLSLFIVFPVTFERSITMYLLTTLGSNVKNSCQGLSKLDLENKFIQEYAKDKAIKKRINEQKIIGFVEENNQCLQLTSRAIIFLKFSDLISKFYNIK